MIAFGGLSWAPGRRRCSRRRSPSTGSRHGSPSLNFFRRTAPRIRHARPRNPFSRRHLLFLSQRRNSRTFSGFDLTIPAGTSLAIVGQNGAGKTTIAKLLCRLYDPQAGAIEVDGVDLRALHLSTLGDPASPPSFRISFARASPPRKRCPPARPMKSFRNPRRSRRIQSRRSRHHPRPRLSQQHRSLRGQWQRRSSPALSAVHLGAGLVLLDEPTAQSWTSAANPKSSTAFSPPPVTPPPS